jgi:hypothetical protein
MHNVVMNSLHPSQGETGKIKPNIMKTSKVNTNEQQPRPERIAYSIHEAA